ncbi:MAG: RnfABCDGE type electron transport complex subunit D, partial [Thiomargarita sp.]|nr:RnfABCDGE type electron transport complex subunit D [Thiomargarita sp.]
MHINTIDNSLLNIRTQLGAKWSVIVLLLPLLIFGTVHFGVRAGFVVSLSVVSCMVFGIIFRILKNDTYQLIHPGSIITGLLLGLTLRAETPVYMIIAGALVAEYIGKHLIVQMQQTLFNPAILGRTFVGILELIDPPLSTNPDMISSASVLAKESGGSVLPDFFDIFFGFTQGAIGETSPFLLLLVGGLLLRYIVLKREAAITMILTVLLMV